MWVDDVLVVILAVLAGAWSLPTRIQFGLDPLGVYIAALLGSTVFAVLVLYGGAEREIRWSSGRTPTR